MKDTFSIFIIVAFQLYTLHMATYLIPGIGYAFFNYFFSPYK